MGPRRRWVCPNCGIDWDEETADIIRHPATWGYNGGTPEEIEIKCPDCGEDLEELYYCDLCGEPIIRLDKGIYYSEPGVCEDCEDIIDDDFYAFFEQLADDLGVPKARAIENAFDRAERREWYREGVA